MIDLDTIKPGQELRSKEGVWTYFHSDSGHVYVSDFSEYCQVADPPVDWSRLAVIVIHKKWGLCKVTPVCLDIEEVNVGRVAMSTCLCDIGVLMSRGCRCGYLEAEKEAAR